MTLAAVHDLMDPDTPPPTPIDDRGRSGQTFLVDVAVRSDGRERRAIAGGRDIYAISAPLAVEATERLSSGLVEGTGVLAAGQAFEPEGFLRSLPLDRFSLDAPAGDEAMPAESIELPGRGRGSTNRRPQGRHA